MFGALVAACAPMAHAQTPGNRAVVAGRVTTVQDGTPIAGVEVRLEGAPLRVVTDSAGRYVLADILPGPYIVVARKIGLAPTRIPVTLAPRDTLRLDIQMAASTLVLGDIVVTAAPAARASDELGTASVIDRDAITNQGATSLSGVLELVPGVPSRPPGLGGSEQFALRSLPMGEPAALTRGGPGAADLASFGTLIILDGVPLSNNANLQTTGPRGDADIPLETTAGGGVDLRRIPASTIERVEVIRGIPSARYGDLTQGVIIVDTRAAAAGATATARVDARSVESSISGGRSVGDQHAVSVAADFVHTSLQPGLLPNDAIRVAAQLAHRLSFDDPDEVRPGVRASLDSRLDMYHVGSDNPERPELAPGRASSTTELGIRVSERLRIPLGERASLRATASVDYTRQRSESRASRLRSALPFTDRLDEGRSLGRFVDGAYQSELSIAGDAWQVYGRVEAEWPFAALQFDHRLFAGIELRREWNAGSGLDFDVERPPQVTFNGVQGFDRPRRFDIIPPVATTSIYLDDRLVRSLGPVTTALQAGVRLDALHDGTTWFSGVRDAVLQPRVNLEVAPWPWLRVRGGIGRTAKLPALGSLYPATQYFDVVNVNWFTTDPAERLAVLTTFLRDPSNSALGYATGTKREVGLQLGTAGRGATLDLVVFDDRTRGGVGIRHEPGFLVRDLYDFADSTTGTGRPPTLIEPPTRGDTVPILLDVPSHTLDLSTNGVEATVQFPQFEPLRLRLHVQGALLRTRFVDNSPDFGRVFRSFQVDGSQPRSPYWAGVTRNSERLLLTYRIVHHRPDLGLVITALVEHIAREVVDDSAGTDTLSYAGYVTRAGELVPVPPGRRADPEFADLRVVRSGATLPRREVPADWFLSLQVSKTLPLDGRLSVFAFNALDRPGRIAGPFAARVFPRMRFGVEVFLPLGW